MGEVKGQGHKVYPVSNRYTSFLFHVNWAYHSWDMANIEFDLETNSEILEKKVIQYIPPDPYFLCPIYLRFRSNGFDKKSFCSGLKPLAHYKSKAYPKTLFQENQVSQEIMEDANALLGFLLFYGYNEIIG